MQKKLVAGQGLNAANNKNLVWGVRTISLQAKALPGASILRTLIIHPPMISTLTISILTILELTISTHLVSVRMVRARMISTLTIAWARERGLSAPPVAPRGSIQHCGGYRGLWSDCTPQ